MSNKKEVKLITNKDVDDVFNGFKNDKERIKYMSQAYRNMSIAKAFSVFYGTEMPTDIKNSNVINNVISINIGGTYAGIVKEFTNTSITFEIPGVKDEIICKENWSNCFENVQNYLLNHDNTLMFEVREHKNGKFIVSVINAYYLYWQAQIKNDIAQNNKILVHIDDLVKGGYVCHTTIDPLIELTGQEYTSSVFIPGSQIVLNIEKDFEKWIGQDVEIIPQNFVEFRKDIRTGLVENSLVGSRKKILQFEGMQNMYAIWNDIETRKKLAKMTNNKNNIEVTSDTFEGTVTGIINSNKKQGAFVELNDKYITGLLPLDSSVLLDYKPGNTVYVTIKDFDVIDGKDPFIIKHKKVVKCNTRPVFTLA